jgi:hypothetical protein
MKNKPESQIKTNTDTQSIPEVYTNAVLTNMTPYEFEITLGLGSSNYEGVRPVVNVRMSPQFAKEFAELLQNNIKLFEDKFGEIKVFKERH